MKRLLSSSALALLLLVFSGCFAGEDSLSVPYSEGPSAPPNMRGPTAPLPQENGNGQIEVMNEALVN